MTPSIPNPLRDVLCRTLGGAAIIAAAALLAVPATAPAQREIRLEVPQTFSEDDVELQVWNDTAFRRRFAESYMAETDIEPTVTEEEREVMVEILDLISTEQGETAAQLLREHMELHPNASATFDFTLANIHFQNEQLDEAAAQYRVAVEKFPKFRRAWKNLAFIYVRQQDFANAIPALVRVIELGESDSVTYGLLGFSYSAVENFLSAEMAYRMAIMLDPETMDWKLGLTRAFFKQQRYNEAIALTRQLISEDSERIDLWMLQANAYIGLNQPKEAAEIYELVDLLGGSTFDSLSILGDIYVNEELYGVAADTYIRALEMAPDGHEDRAIRSAKVLAARGAFDETRSIVAKIDELYGDTLGEDFRKEVLKLRGRLAVAEGASDEEVRILKEIVELDPLDGEALILLGQHASRSGDDEQAVFYYERAAGLEDFEADAKVRHAQLLVGQGKYQEALPLLRRAQQINYRENIQEYLEQVERVAKN